MEPSYPRPRLYRKSWQDLCGEWGFAHDDADMGRSAGWHDDPAPFRRTIIVPYPPESPASEIGDRGFHPVVWYRREIDLRTPVSNGRLILHFGAVDYEADVWVNGQHVASHRGGHVPFSADVTENLRDGSERLAIVVRAKDDPSDHGQPRGKQDWREKAHGIWYNRTTGIWQPVWLEWVPRTYLRNIHFTSDIPQALVFADVSLAGAAQGDISVRLTLSHGDEVLARATSRFEGLHGRIALSLPALTRGQDRQRLFWSPDRPTLIDAHIELLGTDGEVIDTCESYMGLRTVGVDRQRFLLNDHPVFLRSVLSQGYWPESHLAAPSPEAIEAEVRLIKAMGFNAVRIHQKVEDPRFIHWCDRLGLMVWGEMANAYAFDARAVEDFTREWFAVLDRDKSNPSIVTWVPLNESWGVQDISSRPDQQSYASGLYHLTKAIDPTRPVISNDGWEHTISDIASVHDYSVDPDDVHARYRKPPITLAEGFGPQRRRLGLSEEALATLPLMVTEFGGIGYRPEAGEDWFGYQTVTSDEEFETRLRGLFEALHASPHLSGYCYTQLTDTMQESNGLADAERRPKLPLDVLRSMITGPSAAIPDEKLQKARRDAEAAASLSDKDSRGTRRDGGG